MAELAPVRIPIVTPSTSPPEPLLLDYRGAARLLNVSQRTVAGLVAAGKLPVLRIGKLVRFRPADLKSFVEQHDTSKW